MKLNIKEIRLSILLTQEEFAKVLGVSVKAYQNWELDKVEPSLRMKRKIIEYCKSNNIEIIQK